MVKDVNEIKSTKNEHSEILNRLVSDINEVKLQNGQIQKTNEVLQNSVETLHVHNEAMNSKIETLEKEKAKCDQKIELLQKSIQDMARSSRPSTIEIKNIPQGIDESTDDLRSVIAKLGALLKIEIQPSHIRDVYRYPGKPGSTRSIISEFSSVSIKKDFLNAAKAYNKQKSPHNKLNTSHLNFTGDPAQVYIVEFLPGSTRKLFYLAREYSRTNNYKYCWSKDCRIFIQKDNTSKAILIQNEDSLSEISGID